MQYCIHLFKKGGKQLPDEADIKAWQTVGAFVEWLGIEFLDAPEGQARLRLPFKPEFGNRKGDVHGGLIATLSDLATGYAIRSTRTGLFTLATISLTTNYLSPGRGDLLAQGECIRAGRSIAFGEATIEDTEGTTVARAHGCFRFLVPTKRD